MKKWGLAVMATGTVLSASAAAFVAAARRQRRRIDRIWQALQAGAVGETFRPEMVEDLPAPAQRYFRHALREGVPLARYVEVAMSGRLRQNPETPWMPLQAREILAPGRGLVWRAEARMGRLKALVDDYYFEGEGRMRVALFGVLPILNAGGPDIARSSLGRLAIETVWLPAMLLPQRGGRIEAVDDERFKVTLVAGDAVYTVTLRVDEAGRLLEASLARFGDQTESGCYAWIPYGARADAERTFDGYTIPSHLKIGWWFGTERFWESLELTVEDAAFGRPLERISV
jgi:hypothetical protein